jgi:ribose transport system ATP-binding protein
VYISHRLNEIFEIADRVTILKDGLRVGTAPLAEMDMNRLSLMMLGRKIEEIFPTKEKAGDEIVLGVKGLVTRKFGRKVDLTLHKGEILGIAGLVGSGRTELVRAIFGADRKDRGDIYAFGQKADVHSPEDAIQQDIAFVPEERRYEGLILPMSITHNITLASLQKFRRWLRIPVLNHKKERFAAKTLSETIDIRTTDLKKPVSYLSGGNQQKCVLAKWLSKGAKIFIFDEPTRGIDIGAKATIYKWIVHLAGQGAGIILISSDFSEILGLSHRVLVMDRGEIRRELPAHQTDLETIMQLCLRSYGAP